MSYESSAKHPTEVTSLGVKFTSDKVLPSFTVFTKATHELPPSTLITPLPILPKPQQITQPPERNNSGRDSSVSDQHLCLSPYSYHTSHTSHALDRSVRRASDPTASASDSSNRTPTVKRPAPMMTSEEILAEKRRRNAGASARFRDRRKQKEKDLAKRCQILEQRTQELEAALRHYNPNHALLLVSIAPQQLPALPETTHTMKASRFDNGGDSVNNGELRSGHPMTDNSEKHNVTMISHHRTVISANNSSRDTSVVDLLTRVHRLEKMVFQLKEERNSDTPLVPTKEEDASKA